MNLLRNPYLVIGLGLVAVLLVARSLRPIWQRAPRARTTQAQTQTKAAPPAPPPAATHAPASASRPQAEEAHPTPNIDLRLASRSFDSTPHRDPFQVIGPGATNLARLYPPAAEFLTDRKSTRLNSSH